MEFSRLKNNSKNKTPEKEPNPISIRADFDEVYNKYADILYRICFLEIKRPQDTAETVEEVFLKFLLTKKELITDKDKFAFLVRTAKSSVDEYFRTKMRKKIRTSDLRSMRLTFELNRKTEIILGMPAKFQTVLSLKYADGMSEKDIAELLGKSESSIKKLIESGESKLPKYEKYEIIEAYKNVSAGKFGHEHMYKELMRKINEKGFVKHQKMLFAKHRFDRFVPYIALFCICFVVYAFFAVQQGWITGQKFKESTALAEDEGYVYSGENKTLEEVKAYFNGEEYVPAEEDKTEKITVYSVIDGESKLELENLPEDTDGFKLWEIMQEKGMAPENAELITYTLDKDVLSLSFSEEINDYTSDEKKLKALKKSFTALFRCNDVVIE